MTLRYALIPVLFASVFACSSEPEPYRRRAGVLQARCGNERVDQREVCDGSNLNGFTCSDFQFGEGELACQEDCRAFDLSGCGAPESCGNGARDGYEVCDGDDVAGKTCEALGYADGELTCLANCGGFDTTHCIPFEDEDQDDEEDLGAFCGNDVREDDEVCDGSDRGGLTCQTLNFAFGNLRCNDDCSGFDSSACNNAGAVCGDGLAEDEEVCDRDDLRGMTCELLDFASGTLACASDCASFDLSECSNEAPTGPVCGNGSIETGEVCDGEQFGTLTCGFFGFDDGTLACINQCETIDTSGCFNHDDDEQDDTGDDNDGVQPCAPDCAGRVCGLDPVCGTSCGPACAQGSFCNAAGSCEPIYDGPALEVMVSWDGGGAVDPFLLQDHEDFCADPRCYWSNCTVGNHSVDWDGQAGLTSGDPRLFGYTSVNPSSPAGVTIPSPINSHYAVGVHNWSAPSDVAVSVVVRINGEVRLTRTAALSGKDLWHVGNILWADGVAEVLPLEGRFYASFAPESSCSMDSDAPDPGDSSGATCWTHDFCPAGEFCYLSFDGLLGTCYQGCRSHSECSFGQACANDGICRPADQVVGWDQPCSDWEVCSTGLFCGALSNRCAERCMSSGSACDGGNTCCALSGADYCVDGWFSGVCAN